MITTLQAKKLKSTDLIVMLVLGLASLALFAQQAQAQQLLSRSLSLGTPTPSITTFHEFNFFMPSITNIGSIEFEYCSNSPIPGETCIAPTGLDLSTISFGPSDQTITPSFTLHPNTTNGTYPDENVIIITRPTAIVTPAAETYTFNSVVNPSYSGTFYVRITTYAEEDGRNSLPTVTEVDQGSIAASTTSSLTILADVPPYLTFCVGTSIFSNDCSTAAGTQINMSTFSSSTTGTGISKFLGYTNALSGLDIAVLGTTMTSGNNVIDSLNTPSASSTGVSQFGFNLRSNTNPNSGLEPVGPGTISPRPDYNSPNNFKFVPGDSVAFSPVSTDRKTFTANYIVNIDNNQPKGIYSTTLTYVATATF